MSLSSKASVSMSWSSSASVLMSWSSWPYFTVTLRNTWLRITIVLLRVIYDEIRSSTGTRKWLLTIIVGDHCTLSHAYVVYDLQRCITEIVYDRKRPNTSVHDTEKYDPDTFPFLNVYNRILSCTNFVTLDLGGRRRLWLRRRGRRRLQPHSRSNFHSPSHPHRLVHLHLRAVNDKWSSESKARM